MVEVYKRHEENTKLIFYNSGSRHSGKHERHACASLGKKWNGFVIRDTDITRLFEINIHDFFLPAQAQAWLMLLAKLPRLRKFGDLCEMGRQKLGQRILQNVITSG